MGGTNPYVNQEAPAPATQKFTITFLPMNVTVEVDPEKIPHAFWILLSRTESPSITHAVASVPARPVIALSAKVSKQFQKSTTPKTKNCRSRRVLLPTAGSAAKAFRMANEVSWWKFRIGTGMWYARGTKAG